MSHPELPAEQAYVDRAYELLERMRDVVARAGDAADGEVAQAALDAWSSKRLATFEDAERGLLFGRPDFESVERPLYVGRRWVPRGGAGAGRRELTGARGPVSLSTLAVSLGEEPDTIEDVYEPYLLQLGFIQRTPRGRVITKLGREHVGAAPLARERDLQEQIPFAQDP